MRSCNNAVAFCVVQGRAPWLTGLAGEDPAAAIVEGWRRSRDGDWQRLRALEARLAAVSPRHLLHPAAVHLRVDWRRQAARRGEADLAAEAIELLDPLLVPAPRAADLLLRARLAVLAGDSPTALASLFELVHHPAAEPMLRQASAVFGGLPATAREDPRHSALAALLR